MAPKVIEPWPVRHVKGLEPKAMASLLSIDGLEPTSDGLQQISGEGPCRLIALHGVTHHHITQRTKALHSLTLHH